VPPPGWYADPRQPGAWRWWDGRGWTDYVHRTGRPPRLPAWLSAPVIVGAVLVVPLLAYALVSAPLATLLPLPSLLLVLVVFVWFDRLEPEPWQERVHAVLWGATITIAVAGTANTVATIVGGEVFGTVVSAPITEEVMKGLGVLYAVRRRKVDSVTDGIVYAGWIAAGFAAVENVEYFVFAASEGALVPTVIARGVLSPFAHPLFTIWTGMAVGWSVVRGYHPMLGGLPGLLVAIALHAMWNAATVLVVGDGVVIALLLVLFFIGLFALTGIALVVLRLRGRRTFAAMVPQVAIRYGLTPQEVMVFSDWGRTLAVRRSLSRPQRRAFDARHAAIARLVALWSRPHPPDPVVEQQLVVSLWEARADG
jgi:protease PrsW